MSFPMEKCLLTDEMEISSKSLWVGLYKNASPFDWGATWVGLMRKMCSFSYSHGLSRREAETWIPFAPQWHNLHKETVVYSLSLPLTFSKDKVSYFCEVGKKGMLLQMRNSAASSRCSDFLLTSWISFRFPRPGAMLSISIEESLVFSTYC